MAEPEMPGIDPITGQQDDPQDPVLALAASPAFSQDGLCFAARRSGLYRSEDRGITWQPAYIALELGAALATSAVAVSPAFESDHSVFAGVHGAVLRSVTAGTRWQVALLPSPPPLVSTLVVSPNFLRDGTVFAGTVEDGVFRSGDRGSSWASWNFGLLDLHILSMAISPDFANDQTLFVGTESGIFRSGNGGRAWREVDFPDEFAPVLSVGVSPGYGKDGLLMVGTEDSGLFASQDRGRTWTRLGEHTIPGAVNAIVFAPEFPTKPDVLVLLDAAVLISRDGDQSRTHWRAGVVEEEGMAAVVAPHGLDPGAPLLLGLLDGRVLRIPARA